MMIRLDIIGVLISFFLIDVFSWKRVIMAQALIDMIFLLALLLTKTQFYSYTFGIVFTYSQVTPGVYELMNFLPFIIGFIFSKYAKPQGSISVRFLLPWEHNSNWNVIFYKLAVYNLTYQFIRLILRG